MAVTVRNVVMIAVCLLVIAIVLPLGLGYLAIAGEYNVTVTDINTSTTLADVIDPSVITILTILIPILATIGIAIGFISMRD